MQFGTFAATGLRVSEFGLGCARLGGIFHKDPKSSMRLLHAAIDAGINFLDTADMYSQGESEKLIGRAFGQSRDKVIIATKAGWVLPTQRRVAALLKPLLRPVSRVLKVRRDRLPAAVLGNVGQDFSRAYLVRAAEASLRRLRTDYIDLFQLHSAPLDVLAQSDWREAMESLKRAGKIRHYGVSVDSLDAGLAAVECDGVASLQFLFNLLEPNAQHVLLPRLRARNVAGIARECLANGLLVKPLEGLDLARYCSSPEEVERRRVQLSNLESEARAKGTSVTRLALDFARKTEGVSLTLLGARDEAQLFAVLRKADAPA
jgi:aryl-alcohol dehydrogenase-like predicted oxidoreductase